MRTLGIDLAAQPKNTAACMVEWNAGRGHIGDDALSWNLKDKALLALIDGADVSAVDAPFGWPDAFRAAVEAWTADGTWTGTDDKEDTRALRFRWTDHVIHCEARAPLSVSSDRIAVTAMRCARVLTAFHARREIPVDRVGGGVSEVYPAAAMTIWKIDIKGYKKPGGEVRRREVLDDIRHRARLDLSAETAELCVATDHALDAVVCALVARARHVGETRPVKGSLEQIAREGWIHLPFEGSLERLAGALV